MRDAARATRETHRVLADLVAEHGRLEVVHRRWECEPDTRDRLVHNFDGVGVLGGAGALVERDGAVLLVRYGDGEGWSDPGAGLEPGESFADCAERAVRANTGVRPDVGCVAQAHVLYADDWTDRDPVPHPFVLFEAEYVGGEAEPRADCSAVGWFEALPDELRYEELRELR